MQAFPWLIPSSPQMRTHLRDRLREIAPSPNRSPSAVITLSSYLSAAMTNMRMAIEGIGVVGAFGSGVDALAVAVRNGIRPALSVAEVITKEGTRRLPVYRASTEGLEEFFAKRELRRIDHYAKMALLSASLALKDARNSGERPAGPRGYRCDRIWAAPHDLRLP